MANQPPTPSGRIEQLSLRFATESSGQPATHKRKEINYTKESEKRLCKITTNGLTKGEILRHGMKHNCFDQGRECKEDCQVYGKLSFIKMNRILTLKEE